MSDIYTMPGHLIRRLQQISVSVFNETMKAQGIDLTSPQFAALGILADNPDIDQATLAGLIALDRPTLGGVVERLASKGLIERSTNTQDRRSKRLALTPQGHSILDQMRPAVAAAQSKMLSGLSDAEQSAFIAIAQKITAQHNDQSRVRLVVRQE